MDEMAVTRAARVERPDGKTSSEELLAAAHASCYAMALAYNPAGKGALIEGLTVEAVATLDEERLRIFAVDLDVRGVGRRPLRGRLRAPGLGGRESLPGLQRDPGQRRGAAARQLLGGLGPGGRSTSRAGPGLSTCIISACPRIAP